MNTNYVFFHYGDFIPKTTFTSFPCKTSEIYVSGLDANNVYLEDSRGLRIYHDDQVFLCTDNTLFNVYTKDENTFIGDIKITWNTNCQIKTEPYLEDEVIQITNKSLSTSSNSTSQKNVTSNSISSVTESLSTTLDITLTKEEIIHKPIGDINENKFDTQSFYVAIIMTFTILLCIIFIKLILKGDKSK